MPTWWVSEPYINLRLEDEPLGYQPSHGPRVGFGLSYRQRGSLPDDPAFFGVGTNWSCSFQSYATQLSGDPANLVRVHRGGAGWLDYIIGAPQLYDGSILTSVSGGYQIEYADGSIDTFQRAFTNSAGQPFQFLTSQADPTGAANTYNYVPACTETNLYVANGSFTNATLVQYSLTNCYLTNCFLTNCCVNNCTLTNCSTINCTFGGCCITPCCLQGPPIVQLTSIQDADGKITSLYYENSTFTNLITKVVDPFNRTNVLQYDSSGYLTNVADVAGLATSFTYDGGTNRGWITNMTTPYGQTSFRHGEVSGGDPTGGFYGTGRLIRFIEVTLPTGGKELYEYRYVCTNFLPSQYSPLPVTSPLSNTLDNVDQNYRNSFYWGPLQYAHLSTNYVSSGNVSNLTAGDYAIARLRHWLIEDSDYFTDQPSDALSLERVASPDEVIAGEITWFDYDSKLFGVHNFTGTNNLPSFVALVLPDGTTRFTNYTRGGHSQVTREIATYTSASSSVALRTNTFIYATNNVDLLQHIGPLGEQVVSNVFGGTLHQPSASYDALNEATLLSYNAQGQVTSTKTPASLTTTNIYFSSGPDSNRLATVIEIEISKTNSYTYTNGLIYTHLDERGLATTNFWDNLQRLISTTYPDGTWVSNVYRFLDLTATKDRLGYWTYFGYNSIREKIAETNANGVVTLNNYCDCGALLSTTEALGTPVERTTMFAYDIQGNRTNTLEADGYSLTNWFNSVGQIYQTADGIGKRYFSYNNQGGLINVSNALFTEQSIAFDTEDRQSSTTDANGVSVTNTFDLLGRALSRTYPDTGTETFGYSARGLIAQTNQLGFTTFYAYDEARRKTFETNANSEVTRFGYDPSGSLTILTDGKGQNTFWKYDAFGRVTNKTDNLGTSLFSYAYDPEGRLTNRTSAAKGTTRYYYDALGNLTSAVYPVSSNILFAYDALNRLTNMVDGVGPTHYSYDAAGQILSEDGPWADDTLSYMYGNRLRTGLSLQAPNGSPWSQGYAYDAARRPTTLTAPAGAFGYTYDAQRSTLPNRLTFPNGAYITNSYDRVARQLSTKLLNSGGGLLNSHSYGYNQANQRTQQVFTASDYVNYTYDPAGQLKTATGKEAGGATNRLNEQLGYAYDAAGNLNWRTNNALIQGFSVNSLNELTTETNGGYLTVSGTTTSPATNVDVLLSFGGLPAYQVAALYSDQTFAAPGLPLQSDPNTFTAVAQDALGRVDSNSISCFVSPSSFSYDLNGNLISDSKRAFDYDDENELIRVTVTNAWKSEFVYDGKMRRRIRREYTWSSGSWLQTNEVHYICDGNLVIQERDSNNLPQVSYTRGRDLSATLQGAGGIGGLLARSDHHLLAIGNPSAHAYYHADGNGNVTCLVGEGQQIAARYLYDPFGNILSQSGALADANLYRFSSKEIHPNSGLIHYLCRSYDPSLQRWISRDPLGDRGSLLFAGDATRIQALRPGLSKLSPIIETTDGANLQEFVSNDAVDKTDLDGLFVPTPAPVSIATRCGQVGLAFGIGYAAGSVINACTPLHKIGPAIGNKICPLKGVETITCWLSPLSNDKTKCLYHCSTGPGRGFQIVRKPGPNGCVDTIKIVIPDD